MLFLLRSRPDLELKNMKTEHDLLQNKMVECKKSLRIFFLACCILPCTEKKRWEWVGVLCISVVETATQVNLFILIELVGAHLPMQTFSVGKVMQEHNRVQKNTGEKSTNRKEQKGNLCSQAICVTILLGKQHFPTFEDRHKRLKGFQILQWQCPQEHYSLHQLCQTEHGSSPLWYRLGKQQAEIDS